MNLNVRLAEHPLCNRVFQAMADLPWLLDDLALCACNALDGMGTVRGRAASVEDLVAGFNELAGSDVAKKRHPYKANIVMTWISNATGRRESPARGYAPPASSADQLKARRLAREKAS